MYDIPLDRSFLQLSNGIRNVTPSTDRKLELTAKASMAQPVSQPAVCSNGLTFLENERQRMERDIYTECHRRNGPNFGRVFLMLKYTDITQNTYIQS